MVSIAIFIHSNIAYTIVIVRRWLLEWFGKAPTFGDRACEVSDWINRNT
jgi:hypothetical protein